MLACGPAVPVASKYEPKAIIARIAKILTIENQNSISPKNLTCSKLMPLIKTKKVKADAHVGICGHQYWI
ncbi:hypothetical protein D9M71_692450 [compost metagenome]